MHFFTLVSICGLLLCSALLCQYIIPLNITSLYKTVIGIFFAFCSVSPVIVSLTENLISEKFYIYYYNSLFFLFITIVILFNYTFIADISILISHLFKPSVIPSLFNKAFLNKLNILCLSVSVLSAIYSTYSGLSVPAVKTTIIKNQKIEDVTKIVVLSDLHFCRQVNPKKIKGIVNKTNSLKPDIVILAGDIIDDTIKNVSAHLNELKNLKAEKIIFVGGNHEMYRGYSISVNEIKKLGFIVMENNGMIVKNNIFIGGIPDPGRFRRVAGLISSPAQALKSSKKENYRILLSHSPQDFNETDFDLEISGHTHGGQVFPFHFFAKSYNKYLAGLYDIDRNKQIYVSRGSGQWGPQMRFLAPAEISEIIFRPENK